MTEAQAAEIIYLLRSIDTAIMVSLLVLITLAVGLLVVIGFRGLK